MNRLLDVLVALSLTLAVVSAACGGEAATPNSRSTSDAPPTTVSRDILTYIALGDSLSVGIGASNPGESGFVSLVHQSLDEEYELINLGHGGDTSLALIDHGHLDEAIATIEELNNDASDDNDVSLVTLEIGGNDLLGLFFSTVLTGICPDVTTALSKAECYEPLTATLAEFDANFETVLDRLLASAPALTVLVLTLYDPFSGLLPVQSEIAALSLEGVVDSRVPEGLNDIIREHAAERGIPVVELYEPFQNRAAELMASDFIHPNDAGYRVMADAVLETLEDLRAGS